MSIFVTAIYKGLLSSPTLSPAAQQQILRYSVDSKAYELIESLLEHPNLTKEVDALIGEVPASRVKSAWLRRPGRSAKELEALVASYKSQSVLLDLVRTAGMPSELYLAVVNKTDKKAVLVEVATCDHIDKSVKTAAVLRLAKVLPEDPAPTKQASLTEFYQIVQRYPELAESVATTTKNIPLALAALGFGELTPETESKVLAKLTDALDNVITATRREREEKGKNSSASVIFSVSLLTELANLLSAKAGFDKKEIGKITKLAQPLNKALTSYYKSNSGLFLRKGGTAYDDEIALLEAACAPRKAPTGYSAAGGHKKLLADLKECKSPARLEDILDNVRAMKNEIDKDAALKEVFLNEHVTTDILETIDYAFFTTKARDELLSALSKTDRWHLWVARNHWDLSDEEIGMSSDPKATIMALLELPELNTEYALGSLAKSAYLTDDLVPKVTPLLFTAPEVPAKVSNVLDGLLNSKLLSTNDWQTFESMAEDYQGSIGDLLGVISAN